MDKEIKTDQPAETDNSFEGAPESDVNSPSEFIEPLKEVESPPGEAEIDQNPDMNDAEEKDIAVEDQDSADETFSETEDLSGQDSDDDTVEDKEENSAENAQQASDDDSIEDKGENYAENAQQAPVELSLDDSVEDSAKDPAEGSTDDPEGADTELDSVDTNLDPNANENSEKAESAPENHTEITEPDEIENSDPDFSEEDSLDGLDEETEEAASDENYETEDELSDDGVKAVNGKKKRGNLAKLAFSVILMCCLVIAVLTYSNRFKFFKNDVAQQTVIPEPETGSVEPPIQINETKKIDPYARYRSKLREATMLRESLLMKRQEIQSLKVHYAKGIEKLENDILVEMLADDLKDYEQALGNKRVELGLLTIQRRQAYIQKLGDPMGWLEQGNEELLYIKRKAAFDLQLIDIAGSIDMNMHMRHINAAVQKYRLTADNLAIEPDAAEIEPLIKIWERLQVRTENNPLLREELNNWYIQQEICSGNLARIGELSKISIETAKCMSEVEASDLFLNNITELSPSATKYLCQWDGKWLCLNGVNTLSPAASEYLFQWNGEWISLNGLSDFPPELAKQLVQWQGKQLELMGLKDNKNQTDRLTLTYLAEWETAGGKLFVPPHIRNLMNQL